MGSGSGVGSGVGVGSGSGEGSGIGLGSGSGLGSGVGVGSSVTGEVDDLIMTGRVGVSSKDSDSTWETVGDGEGAALGV